MGHLSYIIEEQRVGPVLVQHGAPERVDLGLEPHCVPGLLKAEIHAADA